MTTTAAARSLAEEEDASDVTELTESERDYRVKAENQLSVECDVEEKRQLDELLAQCHEYIYSSHNHVITSSKIITNGSLTSRTPSSPRPDVTSAVMAPCWLELPVLSSRDTFPFPYSDIDRSDVTSHVNSYDEVSWNNNIIIIIILIIIISSTLNARVRHRL